MALLHPAPSLRPSAHERFFAAAAAGMKRSVLNGSERTDRFSKSNMLHFLCGAVAAQRLAAAKEHERT